MPEYFFSAFLVGIIGGMVDLDSTAAWQFMVSQPIVAAPLTGLFLGFLTGSVAEGLRLGLMVGAILQFLWIEQLPLGMNVPPDAALASVISVALGFLASQPFQTYVEREVCHTVALLIAVALGLLGRSLDMFTRRLNSGLDRWVSRMVEQDRPWAISFGHSIGGFLTFTKAFLVCFLSTLGGVEPVRYFTQSLNFGQNTGFIVIEGLLPAVGFAVLASMCVKSRSELKALIGGVLFFTVLPAYGIVPLLLTSAVVWRNLRAKDAGT